ncbi:hypothetical protein HELRODRAFT_164067 [Helobdella robusta]|uniref:Endonuclease/exonuclease/phosphatase domain-containing protein n=1 Tax=Helobdella robusta TaxID=6412 RepID=T1EUV3_HELRO|nr:hypothetical protein HELRODRAFT_164067 [Helobdella robusta]ESN94260.1 hypothetical protein HELRODRAFT_164067 [Helobdella robusta]
MYLSNCSDPVDRYDKQYSVSSKYTIVTFDSNDKKSPSNSSREARRTFRLSRDSSVACRIRFKITKLNYCNQETQIEKVETPTFCPSFFVKIAFSDTISTIPKSETILIGGDLNGHVGEKTDGFDNVHSGFNYGERNEDGNRILEFAESNGFCLQNTNFNKRRNLISREIEDKRKTRDELQHDLDLAYETWNNIIDINIELILLILKLAI